MLQLLHGFILILLAGDDEENRGSSVDGGIPLTLGISMWIFFVGFMLMQYLRPKMPYMYYPRIYSKGDERPFWLSFENLAWVVRAIRAGKDDVALRGGMYGLLFIRFELFMFLYVMIMALLALPILIPLNVIAAGSAGSGFVETTATNIPEGKSSYLIAHTVLTILFVIIGLLIITWYQQMYFHTRTIFRNRDFVNSHTLKLNHVPKSVQQGELMVFMDSLYPNEVKSVQVPPHAPQLLSLKSKKRGHLKKLAQAEFKFQKKGDRPTIKPGTCGWCVTKVGLRAEEDAMVYHKAAVVDTSAKIQRRQKFEHKSTGVAFITFATAIRAHLVTRDFYLRKNRREMIQNCPDQDLRRRLKPEQWTVELAERPQDIYWNHLSTGTLSKVIRRCITFTAMIIAAFAWALPISFLASVNTLEDIPGLGGVVSAIVEFNPFFQDIIEGYIPSLLTTLLVLCLPFVLVRVVMFEKPDTVADRNASVLRLYYIFIILNVVVFPTLLIGTIDSIASLFEDGVESVLGSIDFTLQGAFFINYVLQQTFFSGMIRLVRPQHLFQWAWGRHFAVTDDEKEGVNRSSAHEMVYRIRFAQLLVVIACLLTFAVVVPLILPAGLLFLVVIHIIDKNNILHVFPKALAGDSSMIISVINMFGIALMIYEIMTAIFFYFKQAIWSFSIVVALLGITILVITFLNFLNWYNKYRFIKYGQPMLIEWNLPSDLLERAYIHPGLIDEENDLDTAMDNFISGNGSLDTLMTTEIDRANEEYLNEEQGVVVEKGISGLEGPSFVDDYEEELHSINEDSEE